MFSYFRESLYIAKSQDRECICIDITYICIDGKNVTINGGGRTVNESQTNVRMTVFEFAIVSVLQGYFRFRQIAPVALCIRLEFTCCNSRVIVLDWLAVK